MSILLYIGYNLISQLASRKNIVHECIMYYYVYFQSKAYCDCVISKHLSGKISSFTDKL